MKKIIICSMLMLLFLSGCTYNDSQKELEMQASTVFEALKTENAELFKNVLSSNALNSEDIRTGIAYCFELLGKKEFETEKLGCPEHVRYEYGKTKKWIDGAYTITDNDGTEYFLDFSYWIINDFDENYIGINTLKISEKSNDSSQQDTSSSNYNRFGIYNPEWDIKSE